MSDRKEALFGLISRLSRRRRRKHTTNKLRVSRQIEPLEMRHLLAAADVVPSIQGTVYLDTNANGMFDSGEEIENAAVQLFLDDGDGIFEPDGDDVQVGPDQLTDANGQYCFDAVDATLGYFVRQPDQVVDGVALFEHISSLIVPGTPDLIIDSFQTSQNAEANPPAPSSDGSTLTLPNESEVIGTERDLFVELVSGVGEVQLLVNPFNLLPVLQFNSSSGVQGSAVITWDGPDQDPNPIPSMGLGGRDLTQGGVNVGLGMEIGIDTAGMGETLTFLFYQGNASNVSTASVEIPVTDGSASAYVFIPFADFSGPVSPTNVDAIQMELGMEQVPSADGQVNFVGALGPKIFDVGNDAGADLSVTKSNSTTTVVPGETVSYDILVQNLGPQNVVGATVVDQFPSEITAVTYTSTVSGTVVGNTPNGVGNINDTIDITAGSSLTYQVVGNIDPSATGTLTNTANVNEPVGTIDPNPSNNTDTETDTLTPEVDLQIVKTNDGAQLQPGDTVDYTIVVSNTGPSSVVDAVVADTFPSELLNVSYTSSTAGGPVNGNTLVGSGNINDTVDMAPGSTITYLVTGTLANAQVDLLSNTATVTAPPGTLELDPSNNTSTRQNDINRSIDLAVTKTNNVDSLVPGDTVTYVIVAQNLGPSAANGAVIADNFPSNLQNVIYTSSTTGGATGNTNGSGNINDSVVMPVGSSITYMATGTLASNATGQLSNTATVAPPEGLTETNPNNNTDTDTDPIVTTVDVAVTKTNNVTVVRPNEVLTYQIVVTNNGPNNAVGASFIDSFPAELTNISYTSFALGGASGNTTSGVGNLNETLNLPVNSTVTYTVAATVRETASIDVVNTATVSPPAGSVDRDPSNNSDTDVDTLLPGVDLSINKTNQVDVVFAGDDTTYTITVVNNGPNSVTGAVVRDDFPPVLTSVTYTSFSTGGASGNTNGSGNINDVVNMPVGSTIVYTANADISPLATGQLVNQATVTAPSNVTELNPGNNTSTDTDVIDQALAEISGFVYVDLNDDGIRDPHEPPIPGVEILLEQDDVQFAETRTDTDGAYQFSQLNAGVYDVVEIQPDGFSNGKMTVGGGIGEITGEDRFTVPLQPGDDATELNFGELPIQPSKRGLLASRFRDE